MTLQKQKELIKNVWTKLSLPPMPRRALRMSELLVSIAGVFAIVAVLQFSAMQTPANSAPVAHKKSADYHHAPSPSKPAQPAAAAQPAPVAVTAPVAAKKPAPTAGSSKVEPVVTPSPSSNVSGLAPTAPASGGSSQVTTGYTSLNWSGYMATSAAFTAVSASWHATLATGNGSTTTADSTWIGIGGVTSSDLIQVGTQNIIAANGQETTSAFYEMLPAASINIPSVTVRPGDSMTASVREAGSSLWTISITDNTDGQSFSTTVSYASSLSSAEWIEEDPSFSFRRLIPFDNFQSAAFAGGLTVANGVSVNIANGTAQPVIMVNNSGQYIAVPSVIGADGGSFTVTP